MAANKNEYVRPELTLRYFLFDGDIATISDVNSSQVSDVSDNVTIAPGESHDWWGGGGGMDD